MKARKRIEAMYVESIFEAKKYVGVFDTKGELIRHIDLTKNNFQHEEEIEVKEFKQDNKNQLTFF